MKKIFSLLSFSILISLHSKGQVFWTENFEGGSTSGLVASSYTGPSGAWSITSTGSEGSFPNQWYVSCEENGYTTGGCGTGCMPLTTTALRSTLHVGVDFISVFDGGATYLASSSTATDRRANSPTINCTGRYGITMSFYYIEAGESTDDDASVWYSPDNGTSWSLLVNTPKTITICPGGQGYWTHYSVALPISADNNPNVKVGFRWVNDADATGTDPSFAVDSVSLSGSLSTTTPVPSYTVTPGLTACTGDCLFFDNTTTGAIDSLRWSWTGGPMAATDTMTMCYMAAGTFPITLTVYKSGVPYTTTRTVTVNTTPSPIMGSHTGCVGIPTTLTSTPTGGSWSSSNTAIATVGVTSGIVTGAAAGTVNVTYSVMSCYAVHTFTVYPLPCTLEAPIGSADPGGVEIFPNPAGNELFISNAEGVYSDCEITNEVGQSVLIGAVQGQNTKIDIKSLPVGLYYIRLRGASANTVRRFVKIE